MMMLDRILCPVDFSEPSKRALDMRSRPLAGMTLRLRCFTWRTFAPGGKR